VEPISPLPHTSSLSTGTNSPLQMEVQVLVHIFLEDWVEVNKTSHCSYKQFIDGTMATQVCYRLANISGAVVLLCNKMGSY
jgi:hypothetical protein